MTKRDQIAALVGEEAAGLVYRAHAWLLRGAGGNFNDAAILIAMELALEPTC